MKHGSQLSDFNALSDFADIVPDMSRKGNCRSYFKIVGALRGTQQRLCSVRANCCGECSITFVFNVRAADYRCRQTMFHGIGVVFNHNA